MDTGVCCLRASQVDEATRRAIGRLRYEVFYQTLRWNVAVQGDQERDDFDALDPVYIFYRGAHHTVDGFMRLLPTNGPHMLGEVFSDLFSVGQYPRGDHVWEVSRFANRIEARSGMSGLQLSVNASRILLKMLGFGLTERIREYVFVTHEPLMCMLERARLPVQRLTKPVSIGSVEKSVEKRALVGSLTVSPEAYKALLSRVAGK